MPRSHSPLLSLPRELRDLIYSHLFALPTTDAYGHTLNGRILLDVSQHIPQSGLGVPQLDGTPFSMLAPLCKTCKQLYWEATPHYLSSCILSIEDSITTKYLTGYIERFGTAGWKAIQHIEFADYATKDFGTDHAFLARCPRLRSLGIMLKHTERIDLLSVAFPSDSDSESVDANIVPWLGAELSALLNPPDEHGVEDFRSFYVAKVAHIIVQWDLEFLVDLGRRGRLEELKIGMPDERMQRFRWGGVRVVWPQDRIVMVFFLEGWLRARWGEGRERGREIEVETGFGDCGKGFWGAWEGGDADPASF